MSRTRVKICGITRRNDALDAVEAGADALGFVFYAPSPRAITVERFVDIAGRLPPFVCKVGLFVNPQPADVEAVLATGLCDLLQFHGDEDEAFCARFGKPYMKAIRVHAVDSALREAKAFPSASALLFDAWDKDVYGGSGRQFDWAALSAMRANIEKPLVLAGGLAVSNVAEAIAHLRPWAVDVSGGVEAEEAGVQQKGIKSRERMKAFINEVNRVQ